MPNTKPNAMSQCEVVGAVPVPVPVVGSAGREWWWFFAWTLQIPKLRSKSHGRACGLLLFSAYGGLPFTNIRNKGVYPNNQH